MLEWLIKELFKMAMEAMKWFIERIVSTFGFDLTYFTDAIPIVSASYSIFQAMAAGFVMLFLIWQCVKAFGAPIGIEGDDPIRVFFKSILAVFCIYHAQEIFNQGFIILNPIYDQIMNVAATGEGYTINTGSAISTGIVTIMNLALQGTTMSMFIAYAILLLIILFQLIKMLIELTERYILIGILAVTSPLGFSTMTTKPTSNIFAAWSRMVMGQFIIYLLNFWIIKAFLSGFEAMPPLTAGDGAGIVWLIFMWAFLKVAQKLDQFLEKLGIEVGNVGSRLLEEVVIGSKATGAIGKYIGGGKSSEGLTSALKTAAGGGVAAVAGAGMFKRAVGTIGGAVKKSWEGSVLNGLASYNKNGGAAAFKMAKEASASKGAGAFASNMAGVGAWVTNGIREAAGQNARIGRDIAKTMNSGVSGDFGFTKKVDLDKLKHPTVAANVVNHLNRKVEGADAIKMLEGLMGGQSIGDLTPDMVKSANFKCTAHHGGIKWTYFDGEKELKGHMAIQGNNPAFKELNKFRKENKNAYTNTIHRAGGLKIDIAYIRRDFYFLKN